MKNLYKITFSHHGPKNSEKGIKTYLLANTDDEVYEWFKTAKDPDFPNSQWMFPYWDDEETEQEVFDVYDDKYNAIGTETYKEKIIRLKGNINDDEVDFTDSYYGITLYGWEFISEVDEAQSEILLKLGIAFNH